jgi:hypothetical protein
MNVRIGVIVSSVLLTAASVGSAQSVVTGLTAGGTYSDFQYPDTKSRWGFSGGLFVGAASHGSLSTLEVNYTQKGGEGARIDYVETGVNVGAVVRRGQGARARFYGGIMVAFPVSCDAPNPPRGLTTFCDNTGTEWGSPLGLMFGKWNTKGGFVGLDVRYTFPWSDASLGVNNQVWRFSVILGRAKGGTYPR